MALEEANTIYLPFVGEYEIDSGFGVVMLVFGLIGGAFVWNMADGIGQNLANSANNMIGSIIGQNPATGEESSGPEGV